MDFIFTGDWNLKMVQCEECLQWFHEACVSCLSKPILNGDLFYAFKCARCNQGEEALERLPLSWSEALHLILYNLNLMRPSRFYRYKAIFIRPIRTGQFFNIEYFQGPFFKRNKFLLQERNLILQNKEYHT